MRVLRMHRHPVKGLSPEALEEVFLSRGQYFPGDRLYAIENGPSGFDPKHPAFLPKTKFVMLMKQARLAALETRYDDATRILTIRQAGEEILKDDLGTAEGRASVAGFVEAFCEGQLRGPARVLAAPDGFRFMDSPKSGFVSLLNRASIEELERAAGAPIDPLRFRANVELGGGEPWEEADWVGRTLRVRELELKILKPIERCAAIDVRPGAGERDLNLAPAIRGATGNCHFGVYAKIVASGRLMVGDRLIVRD